VELAITITDKTITAGLAAVFFLVSVVVVSLSKNAMRIPVDEAAAAVAAKTEVVKG